LSLPGSPPFAEALKVWRSSHFAGAPGILWRVKTMKARAERLKNRGDQLRASGLSVSATLDLYAGSVAGQEKVEQLEAEKATAAEEPSG